MVDLSIQSLFEDEPVMFSPGDDDEQQDVNLDDIL